MMYKVGDKVKSKACFHYMSDKPCINIGEVGVIVEIDLVREMKYKIEFSRITGWIREQDLISSIDRKLEVIFEEV